MIKNAQEQYVENNLRHSDIQLMRELLQLSHITLTEKRHIEQLDWDVSHDIVNHYVLTNSERERLLELKRFDALQNQNLTEQLLEEVYKIRWCQDRGHTGYVDLKRDKPKSMRDWILLLLRELGQTFPNACRNDIYKVSFKHSMLELAAMALAAAEWNDSKDLETVTGIMTE